MANVSADVSWQVVQDQPNPAQRLIYSPYSLIFRYSVRSPMPSISAACFAIAAGQLAASRR